MSSYYLTTPIYYVNDAPHIGHAYTTVIGDAVTRWHRMLGDDVRFLTGTDEHGLKVQRTADEKGVTPQEWADQTAVRFVEAWTELGIKNDDFIRTTEPRHYDAVKKLLRACYDNGAIELKSYEGLYCVACEAYYVEADLLDGTLCPIHKRPVERFAEENYFFKLSEYEKPLLDWYARHPDFVRPDGKRNEALGFIKQGLNDFSISRTSITWGIPLPWDEKHVTYVWFDALTNYLSSVGYGRDDAESKAQFEKFWPGYHVIGKDILRFHCVYWPAMLLAAGIEPPLNIFVHGFLLVGGEKMSKTGLTQIAPHDLIEDFGVDGYRYHFLSDVIFGNDGDFSYEGMTARYNADLANNLGNLLARVATVVGKKYDGIGPKPSPTSPLAPLVATAYEATAQGWADFAPSTALRATWDLVRATNAHLEKNEPWKAEPGPEVDAVMGDALEALRIVAVLASPAIPASSQEIWERLGLPGLVEDQRLPQAAAWGGYPGGLPVTKGESLFPRR